MNVTEIKNRLELICSKHIAIAHSELKKHFWSNIAEFTEELKSKAISPVVLMGAPRFEPIENKKDNTQELNTLSTLILTYVKPKAGNTADQLAAYDTCKEIAIDFISYLMNDESEGVTGMLFTDPNNFAIELAGPILDNYHGVELFIEFTDSLDLSFNDSKWIE